MEAQERILVAADAAACAADDGELIEVAGAARWNTRMRPKRLLADGGCKSEEHLRRLERRGIDSDVALGEEESQAARSNTGPAAARIARKLASRRGRARHRQREALVEPVIGWIEHAPGYRAFLLRGLKEARGEWRLVCLAMNVKQLDRRIARARSVTRAISLPRAARARENSS